MRAFQAEDAEHVLLPDEQAPPAPPEGFQAEDAEHVPVTRRQAPQHINPADEVPVGQVAGADPLPAGGAELEAEQRIGEQLVDGGRERAQIGRVVDEQP